jgi:choice-of-anchor B domain-containing protein
MSPSLLRSIGRASFTVLLLVPGALSAQVNIEFVGSLSYQNLRNSDISNLWGYADEAGNEYALVGVNGTDGLSGGFSVVDLADPTDPQEVFFLPGPASIWREIKVWNDHAYITTEAENGGLTIVDLSPLPQSTDLPSTVWFDPAWDTSHSLFIDENGRLYIHGANEGTGGVIMYDLTEDPMAPVRVGQFDQWYVHDSFARGDTLYAAHILDGFFTILDVSDPAEPVLLGLQNTPNNFTHNVWLDDTGRYLYTTDERTNAYVAAYDVSDPSDIQFLDKLRSDGGSGAIPHNTYWLPGDYLVQSYYTYGVSIYDCSQPENLIEVGSFDTSPFSGNGFFGAWGVYPFLPSGRLLISDIEEGLFILDPTYVRGCGIAGQVTSTVGGTPVGAAEVRIASTTAVANTGITGEYSMGTLVPGSYTITASAPGYFPGSVSGVQLQTGSTTELDIQLDPLPSYVVEGTVRTLGTLEPVPGAQVWVVNETYTFQTTTDADGSFNFPNVFNGTYTVDVVAWGWHGACPPDLIVNDAAVQGWTIDLEPGYSDDFAMDLGWQVSATASRGVWERGRPSGTTFQEQEANPGSDVVGDCRDKAYVTGNSGGAATNADVDEGGTLLTSPVFDATDGPDPHVRYHYWFFAEGGSAPSNDALVISLANGTDTVAIQTVEASESASQWRFSNIRIADHIEATSTMRLLVYTEDPLPEDHLVEAAFDDFSIAPSVSASVAGIREQHQLRVWPVPAQGGFTIATPDGVDGLITIRDLQGRILLSGSRTIGGIAEVAHVLHPGAHTVTLVTDDGRVITGKLLLVQ